jgi:hypothetical protein
VSIKSSKAEGRNTEEVSAYGAPSDEKRALVIHRQRAIKQAAGDVLDLSTGKRSKVARTKKTDEVSGREDQLGLEARRALRGFAAEFIRVAFNRQYVS